MPEGDTVYLTGRRLHAALAGQRLVRAELRHPRLAAWPSEDLSGRIVLGVRTVGKHLLTRFDDGRSLHSHLRMDGSWHLYGPEMAWQRPVHEVRARHHELGLVLLDRNKDRPEQSTTGEWGRGRRHWVYERRGQPCRRCGTRIRVAEQGAGVYARPVYWCPRCQPGPAPA